MLPEARTVLHTWCRQTDWHAPTIVGGEGARLLTADGHAILDMSSLAECSNLGHQHPKVVEAIRTQAARLCFVTSAWGAQPRAQLAELLLEKAGFDGGRVFFTLGGADGNEHAVKFARQASGRPSGWVITRDRSYHGASYAAMALSGDTRTAAQADPATYRVIHVPPPYAYRCPFHTATADECGQAAAAHVGATIDARGAGEVAAVLMEPNAGTNGIVAPRTFWPALREATRDRGVYLIADEVMSGFGRCGEWFAWQRYGSDNRPDLMTLAKGLTGAHAPLGAVLVTAEVARVLESQTLMTGLTYSGHPLSCAAGVAAIESYQQENLISRSRTLGAALFARLRELQARHALIGDVRGGDGLFAVLELVRDRVSREPLAPWPQMHPGIKALLQQGMAAGVSFAARGNLILLAPPLVIDERELAKGLDVLDGLLTNLERTLRTEGGRMSFKLTYATMFEPPAALHASFESAVERVREDLGGRYFLYVNGEDRPAERYFTKTNPANTGEILGEFAAAGPQDVDAALLAASAAWPAWRRTPLAERARLMRRVAQLIEERVYDIAAALSLEVGKNRMEALGEAQESADFFTLYTQEFERQRAFDHALPDDPLTSHVSHNRSVLKPYGPWVVIAPFNFPLALAAGPTAAALITGNTVVAKGASATPWADRLLADCIRDAGVPPGVFNYLSGPGAVTGATLTAHPLTAGVTFTGSYEVGMGIVRALQSPPFPRPCIAEMGGKNACIVTAGADLDRAALGIIRSAYGMGGQKCSALSRLYVDHHVADGLIERLLAQISAIRIGDPVRREHWLGPVTTASGYESYARYSAQLRTHGARILSGGEQLRQEGLERGFYVRPTLAEAPLTHPLWKEELFLPILMLHRASPDAAMSLANESSLGLTAGFYGAAEEVAWFNEHIQAGVTYANRPQGATTGAWPGYQAFGGWKGSGSTGKAIGSFYYLPQYLHEQSQTVVE